MSGGRPIRIDLQKVLDERLGERSRYVPSFIVRALEKLICQDEMNSLLENNFPLQGADFCRGVLRELDVKLHVRGSENMPMSPRCIVVSDHPLGGLDGITMIAWLSSFYGNSPVHFVVNDLLMAIDPLKECFVPVNKHGAQSRKASALLDSVLAGDNPVVIYPAGLVSRLNDKGEVRDLIWRKMAVTKAIDSHRDVVPVHFGGENSPSFYRWARLRKRLGIRFNYEMVLLPREVMRARGKDFTLTVGEPVAWQKLAEGRDPVLEAALLRKTVYSLPSKYDEL